jgi:hypothetical protein
MLIKEMIANPAGSVISRNIQGFGRTVAFGYTGLQPVISKEKSRLVILAIGSAYRKSSSSRRRPTNDNGTVASYHTIESTIISA